MLLIVVIKKLFDKVLSNDKEWSKCEIEELNYIVDAFFSQYHDDKQYILDMLIDLKEKGYDICYIWSIIKKLMYFKQYAKEVAEISMFLNFTYINPISILFNNYHKITLERECKIKSCQYF